MTASHITLTITACEYTYVKEVTKAILHAILFHRTFGQIVPKTQDLLDLTIPSVDDASIEALVDDRAALFVKSLPHPGTLSTATPSVVVEFYEKKTRKAWFSRGEEEVCWESWTLDVQLIPASRTDTERRHNLKVLSEQLEAVVFKILTIANLRNDDYIPPIPYNEPSPFPYQILIR